MIAFALLAAALAQAPAPQVTPTPASTPDASTTAAEAPTDPTPSQLFARAVEAVGPLKSTPFLRAEGVVETPEGRSDVTILWSARPPRRIVLRERLSDGRVAEWGCDATRGWMRVPGRLAPLEVETAAVLAVRAAFVPSNMVMALADRFPIRTSATPETLDGVRCTRVALEDRDGLPGVAWFECDTGRLRAFQTQPSRTEAPSVTTIQAWTKVGPLTLPSSLVSRTSDRVTRTTFTHLSTNAIPDADFTPPLPPPTRD